MKKLLKPIAKSILIPLGLTAAVSAADTGINKNILGTRMTTLIISNKEMKNIMKMVKSLEKFNFLLKAASDKI